MWAAGLKISLMQRQPGLPEEEEWIKEGLQNWDMLVWRSQEMFTGPQNRTLVWDSRTRLNTCHRSQIRSGGLLAFAQFTEWGCEREEKNNASRHFYVFDNCWPVPRQEENRLLSACAILLRPQPIQLGVENGEASVFQSLLQLSCHH